MPKAAFDTWTDKYDSWFDTPAGRLIKEYEAEVLMALLDPQPGERILDAGCGTGIFTRVFSMTAIEFVADAARAVSELERVTRPGGCIVVTTLNSLSPWADRRKQKAESGHTLFRDIYFRSPDEMCDLAGDAAVVKTAVHFAKDDPVSDIPAIEKKGKVDTPDTGAFLAVQWFKKAE